MDIKDIYIRTDKFHPRSRKREHKNECYFQQYLTSVRFWNRNPSARSSEDNTTESCWEALLCTVPNHSGAAPSWNVQGDREMVLPTPSSLCTFLNKCLDEKKGNTLVSLFLYILFAITLLRTYYRVINCIGICIQKGLLSLYESAYGLSSYHVSKEKKKKLAYYSLDCTEPMYFFWI